MSYRNRKILSAFNADKQAQILLNLAESPLFCMGMNGSPEQGEGKSFFQVCKKLSPLGGEVHYSCGNLMQEIGGGEIGAIEGL